MSANTYHGQTGRLIASVATSMPPLSAVEMQRWIDDPNGLKRALAAALSPSATVEKTGALARLGTFEVTLPSDLDPAEYYRDRPGLVVWNGFDRGGFIVKQAKPLPAGTKFRFNIDEIVAHGGATDAEIEAALGDGHLFDETQVAGLFAALFAGQPKGEDGPLLTNGYANLAYASSGVARANRDDGDWHADALKRDDCWWVRGVHVLSPAN